MRHGFSVSLAEGYSVMSVPAPNSMSSGGELPLKTRFKGRDESDLQTEIDSLQCQLRWAERRLARKERTLSARISTYLNRIESRIAPVGSRRRRATATLRTGMAVLLTEGAETFTEVLGRWLRGERGYWRRLAGGRYPNDLLSCDSESQPFSDAVLLIDEPRRGAKVLCDIRIVGRAFDPAVGPDNAPGVDTVRIQLGSLGSGRLIAEVRPTLRRTDHTDVLGLDPAWEFCGFEANLEGLPPGEQFLTVCGIRDGRVIGSVAWLVIVSASDTTTHFRRPGIADPALRAFCLQEEPGDTELRRQLRSARSWTVRPGFDLISRAGCAEDLEATFESLRQQTYDAWTWYVETRLEQQAAVAALAPGDNRLQAFAASAVSDGLPGRREFLTPLAPGDLLAPNALHALASEIRLHPETALVFSDDDRLDDRGRREKPFFKPDWSPELALSTNIVEGLTAIRRSRLVPSDQLADCLGLWDVSLRLHREGEEIRHVPEILCHRSTREEACPSEATASMLARNLSLSGVSDPTVSVIDVGSHPCTRLRWKPSGDRLVSIVIVSRTPTLTARCLDGVLGRFEDVRFEVIVVTTGGRPELWVPLQERFDKSCVEFFQFDRRGESFNFQRACNAGRARARGDALLFLNDDVVVRQERWLSRLVQWLDIDGVGAVGPKLLYPDGRIQHAGVVLGMTGFASHVFRRQIEGTASCFASDDWYRNCSALTAACLLIPSPVFDRLNGFDERFTLLFGDVDLCLRLTTSGLRLVYTPDVRLVHTESSTRRGGVERVPRSDWELLTQLWLPALVAGDPFYNRNLGVRDEQPYMRNGADDTPVKLNEQWMERLPRNPLITFPDDLPNFLIGGSDRNPAVRSR